MLGHPPVKVQPRKAPVPASAPAPEDDPPEDEPEEPPDEDVDAEPDEPELDPEEEPDDEPEDDPDDEPEDEPESGPPEPPPSASLPSLPGVLEQAPNAKAVASTGTPSDHRATMRASLGGCLLFTNRALRAWSKTGTLRPVRGENPTVTVWSAPRPETPTRDTATAGVSTLNSVGHFAKRSRPTKP